jgi:putative membrane protein
MEKEQAGNKVYLRIIYLISILIPLIVAFLIYFPAKLGMAGDWVKFLPGLHATINSLTVLTLGAALIAIKNGKIKMHRSFMFASLFLGVLFLLSYVLYHSSVESVKFGDLNFDGKLSEEELTKAGTSRVVYLVILASHILLSILVVPFVLFAFYYALTNQIDRHKRMVRYTYPVWLYVSITGVVVYFMIKPYYFL